MGTCDHDANGEATSGDPTRARVRMRDGRDGTVRSSDEAPVMGAERRGRAIRGCVRSINQVLSWEESRGRAEVVEQVV